MIEPTGANWKMKSAKLLNFYSTGKKRMRREYDPVCPLYLGMSFQ